MGDRQAAGQPAATGKAWASGRVLTAEQRARKRDRDRRSSRLKKQEAQSRISALEARVFSLEQTSVTPTSNPASAVASQDSQLVPDRTTLTGEASVWPAQPGSRWPQSWAEPPWNGATPAYCEPPGMVPNDDWGGVPASLPSLDTPLVNRQRESMATLSPGTSSDTFYNGNQEAPPTEPYGLAQQQAGIGISSEGLDCVDLAIRNAAGRELTVSLNYLVKYIRSMPLTAVCFDDHCNQDLIINAALKGWDIALGRYQQRCPLWDVLRMVDQALFHNCSIIQRIGSLRMLHKRYLFEISAHVDVVGPLQPWWTQGVGEAPVLEPVADHLPWPKMREVALGKNLLSNRFWNTFARNITFNWPMEPFDAIQFSRVDGLYTFTPSFEQAIVNLENWRMNMQFFYQYPELSDGVAPADYAPLRPLSIKFGPPDNAIRLLRMQAQMRQRQQDPRQKLTVEQHGLPRIEEQSGLGQRSIA